MDVIIEPLRLHTRNQYNIACQLYFNLKNCSLFQENEHLFCKNKPAPNFINTN